MNSDRSKPPFELTQSRWLDPELDELLNEHGDWPRLLDPSFVPPEKFLTALETLGYKRAEFLKMRRINVLSERNSWISILGLFAHLGGKPDGELYSRLLDKNLPKILELGISDLEIKQAAHKWQMKGE